MPNLALPEAQGALDALGALGETITIGAYRPIALTGGHVWIVRTGRVDVFLVAAVEDGVPAGARTHLLRRAPGDALVGRITAAGGPSGGPSGGPTLVAVGAAGTTLLRIASGDARAAVREPVLRAALADAVDGWVDALCATAARDAGAPNTCRDLDAGPATTLPPGTMYRPRRGVAWVTHERGASRLLGRESLAVDGDTLVPVAPPLWLQTAASSHVRLDVTTAAWDGTGVWAGLDWLHGAVVQLALDHAAATMAAERARLGRRRAASAAALAGAVQRLTAPLRDLATPNGPSMRLRASTASAPREGGAVGGTLVAACRLVGEAADIAIKTPPSDGSARHGDPLAAIAKASRVRTRQVVLQDGWTRSDAGPLLGFVADGNRPVALLPARRRTGAGYVLHDPAARTITPVDAAVAETLRPIAIAFYRPFPDTPLGLRDVMRFGMAGSRADLRTAAVVGAAGGILGMVPSLATASLFNTVIPGAQRGPLVSMVIVLLVAAMATSLFGIARAVAMLRIEGRMGSAVQAAVWDRLLSLPMPFFRAYTAGDLAVRAMSIDAIRQALSGAAMTTLLGGLFSVFNFALLFYYSTTLAWWATLLIAIALAAMLVASYAQLRQQREITTLRSRVSGLVVQFLSSVAKLRTAAAEVQAFAVWARAFSEQRRLQFEARRVTNGLAAFNAAFPVIATVVIFLCAGPLFASAHGLRTGDFLGFLSAFSACMAATLATGSGVIAALSVIPLYESAKPILVTRPEVDQGKTDPGVLTGDIEVQHVSFRYRADAPLVLRDMSMRIAPGEFVALVGPSGSGKSTLLRMLLGFEAPDSGALYLDGQDITGLDVQAVRRQIGVVLQSGRLTSGDIFTNIVGSSLATHDDAWEAARMAGLDRDLESMPMGMHTVISEGGGTLSGGQRQRLLIARAIVGKPRILYFDEATSALDNRTQSIVSASLERLRATRIVVAHRLSTVMNADRIYVVQAGRIVQSGTYGELLAQPGLFAELAARQIA